MQGDLGIECERDRPVGLGATLGDGLKIKNNCLVSGIFPGKADYVILLGFEYTINPGNLIKIVAAIFEKFKILNFFVRELPLISRVDRKRKKRARDICKGTPDIEFEKKLVSWFRRYVR